MAEDFNEIDKLFRQRFENLKDHSIDPQSSWISFESSMNRVPATQARHSFEFANMSVVLAAAVIVSSVFSFSSSKSSESADDSSSITFVESPVFEPSDEEVSIKSDENHSFTAKSNNLISKSETQPIKTDVTTSTQSYSASSSDFEQNTSSNLANSKITNKESFESINVSSDFNKSQRIKESIQLIACNKPSEYEFQLLPRSAPQMEDPTIEKWNKSFSFYLKSGLRSGTGESNSFEINSQWKLNFFGTIGMGYALTSRSYISAEVGLIRRSGNGIERTRQIDISSLIATFDNYPNLESNQKYIVHESLIATRMDYVHIPIALHYLAFQNSEFFVGGFADVLISAQNKAYIVYDNKEYRANPYGQDLKTMNGLNRIRYGVQLGYEHNLTEHISGTFIGMMPLNGAVDESSGYGVFDQSNKPIDVQLALKYRL